MHPRSRAGSLMTPGTASFLPCAYVWRWPSTAWATDRVGITTWFGCDSYLRAHGTPRGHRKEARGRALLTCGAVPHWPADSFPPSLTCVKTLRVPEVLTPWQGGRGVMSECCLTQHEPALSLKTLEICLAFV